jgi:hypothetical protein
VVEIEAQIPLLEAILTPFQGVIGKDYAGYRNHVYRMLHFCFALRACTAAERETLIIAAAFHDIGIWTDQTVDYLAPSIAQAVLYLRQTGREAQVEEISRIIDLHHKLTKVDDARYPLIEVFRQGDLADFSLGLVKAGLPRDYVKAVQAAFPNHGFHKRLVQMAGGWFAKHPLSPPPFMKW